ncbi:hypothetical protein BJ166DRAFT_595632 [Pestalotiopsis sp. NC0098]|nr:hypothetical protein BJ166DRAFT_595632 [Pestalotiopsis sp. NC0098]
MKFFSIFTTICLAGTALACANGPYDTGSACSGDCVGLTRCGDDNHVIQCQGGKWTAITACVHCKSGGCI